MRTDNFKEETAINALLYILAKLGGRCDIHKVSKIFYFADREHLSRYGRTITGDMYISMQYGPVPSKINDIMKAVRGDSYFEYNTDKFRFVNRYIIELISESDTDFLSQSDIECLDYSIELCRYKSFDELTSFSHGLAWTKGCLQDGISYADMLTEIGDDQGYIDYVMEKIRLDNLIPSL